jgi:ribosomal protein S18 acetylase RimI-like enzyme
MRLAALAEAPDAFGSTLADWTGDGDVEERWRARLAAVPWNLLAELGGRPVGMASATAPENGEVGLISMWVAPSARSRGVGAALIEAIADRAGAEGATRVALDVRQANRFAIGLYERSGFVDVGWSSGAGGRFPERRMVRELREVSDDISP